MTTTLLHDVQEGRARECLREVADAVSVLEFANQSATGDADFSSWYYSTVRMCVRDVARVLAKAHEDGLL
jgi:hypothetical protein